MNKSDCRDIKTKSKTLAYNVKNFIIDDVKDAMNESESIEGLFSVMRRDFIAAAGGHLIKASLILEIEPED